MIIIVFDIRVRIQRGSPIWFNLAFFSLTFNEFIGMVIMIVTVTRLMISNTLNNK